MFFQFLIFLAKLIFLPKKQSPFFADFQSKVLQNKSNYPKIENCRQTLLRNNKYIEFQDFGAGSKSSKQQTNYRKIADIAKYSAINPKNGQMLNQLVVFTKAKIILELGTSLGIATSYLAINNLYSTVYTIEACSNVLQIAKYNFSELGLSNIVAINGQFDNVLPNLITQIQRIDMVYIDGNHTYEATRRYFEWIVPYLSDNAAVVFDDIHWSVEMTRAWNEIIKDERVTLSVDLFFQGIIFLNPMQKRANFCAKY